MKCSKRYALPECHMFQPFEWVCPSYNLDVVDQINPGKDKGKLLYGQNGLYNFLVECSILAYKFN